MAAVTGALGRHGSEPLMVDQRHYAEVRGELTVSGSGTSGWIAVGARRLPFDELTGYYLRPYPVAASRRDGLSFDQVTAIDQLLLALAEAAPPWTAVVNMPSAMASNDSKPAQTAMLQAMGFLVPETIVTNDRDVAEAFWRRYGTVVYKSTSGIRSIASTLTAAHRERLDRLVTCPTQFQEFIPGDDYRVHVVAEQAFATLIVSDATDYRYAMTQGATRTMTPVTLPDEIASRCLDITRALGLLVSGIDLRQTPDGDWYCFEVNTSPAFSWFEDHTAQPITEAVSTLLNEGRR
jgi:glutathione synthase/RimK-type ligase-like ATP-grasp enzyme